MIDPVDFIICLTVIGALMIGLVIMLAVISFFLSLTDRYSLKRRNRRISF
jgi:Tfp pilus assembly protein PilW